MNTISKQIIRFEIYSNEISRNVVLRLRGIRAFRNQSVPSVPTYLPSTKKVNISKKKILISLRILDVFSAQVDNIVRRSIHIKLGCGNVKSNI